RRCRPPNLGGSVHRRSSHRPPAPWPRSLPQTLGRGARRTRKTVPTAASGKRIPLPRHRQCTTERSGKLRVNMRISGAASGEYLWAGRHEFRPEDLAAIQPKITRRISRELHVLLLQAASRDAVAGSSAEPGVAQCLSRATDALAKGMRAELSAE